MPFDSLRPKVSTILANENESVDQRLTEICELLQASIGYYDWVGFYFANEETRTLHLRAFAGEPTEHTVIPFGKGICGQVAENNENFVVADVKAQNNSTIQGWKKYWADRYRFSYGRSFLFGRRAFSRMG